MLSNEQTKPFATYRQMTLFVHSFSDCFIHFDLTAGFERSLQYDHNDKGQREYNIRKIDGPKSNSGWASIFKLNDKKGAAAATLLPGCFELTFFR
jgi:hypothetical protein